jgi:hypothetical protein
MAPAALTFEDFDRLGRELLESGWAGRADETVADLRRRERAEAIALAGGGGIGGDADAGANADASLASRADAAAAHEAGSGLLGAAPLRPARVLEVVGPTGSGKSEVLYHAAARFLVATALEAAEEGRRRRQEREQEQQQAPPPPSPPQHAVLLDMDGKLSLERLHRVASAHAKAAYRGYVAALAAASAGGRGGAEAEAATAAAAAGELLAPAALLQRLHVAQPRSSVELLATLAALPERMARLGGRWRLLLMDGSGAFAWRDRAAGQGGAGGGGGGGGGTTGTADGGAGLSHMRAQTAAADLVAVLGERLRVARPRAGATRLLGGGGGGGAARRRSSGEDGGFGGGGNSSSSYDRLVVSEQPAPRWQTLIAQRLVLAPPPPLQAALAQQLAVPGSATALLAQWQRPPNGGAGGGGRGGGGGAGGQPLASAPPLGLWALDDGRLVEDGSGTVATNRAWLAVFAS